METTLPEDNFDIIALSKKAGSAEFKSAVQRLIEITYGITVIQAKREVDAYVLRPMPGRDLHLEETLSGVYSDEDKKFFAPTKGILERMKMGEHFFFTTSPLRLLADGISYEIEKPVVADLGEFEKKYTDVYTICFPCEKSDLAGFVQALEKNVGLTLVAERREMDVLIVRSRTPDK